MHPAYMIYYMGWAYCLLFSLALRFFSRYFGFPISSKSSITKFHINFDKERYTENHYADNVFNNRPRKVIVEIRGLMLLLLPLSPRWTLSVSLCIHVCLRENFTLHMILYCHCTGITKKLHHYQYLRTDVNLSAFKLFSNVIGKIISIGIVRITIFFDQKEWRPTSSTIIGSI